MNRPQTHLETRFLKANPPSLWHPDHSSPGDFASSNSQDLVGSMVFCFSNQGHLHDILIVQWFKHDFKNISYITNHYQYHDHTYTLNLHTEKHHLKETSVIIQHKQELVPTRIFVGLGENPLVAFKNDTYPPGRLTAWTWKWWFGSDVLPFPAVYSQVPC